MIDLLEVYDPEECDLQALGIVEYIMVDMVPAISNYVMDIVCVLDGEGMLWVIPETEIENGPAVVGDLMKVYKQASAFPRGVVVGRDADFGWEWEEDDD